MSNIHTYLSSSEKELAIRMLRSATIDGVWDNNAIRKLYPNNKKAEVIYAALDGKATNDDLATLIKDLYLSSADSKRQIIYATLRDYMIKMNKQVFEEVLFSIFLEQPSFQTWHTLGKIFGYETVTNAYPKEKAIQWVNEFADALTAGYDNSNLTDTHNQHTIVGMLKKAGIHTIEFVQQHSMNNEKSRYFNLSWLSQAYANKEIDKQTYIDSIKDINTKLVETNDASQIIKWIDHIRFMAHGSFNEREFEEMLQPIFLTTLYKGNTVQEVVNAYVKHMNTSANLPEVTEGSSFFMNIQQFDSNEFGAAIKQEHNEIEETSMTHFVYGQIQNTLNAYANSKMLLERKIPFIDNRLYPFLINGIKEGIEKPIWLLVDTPEIQELRNKKTSVKLEILTHIWITTRKALYAETEFENLYESNFQQYFAHDDKEEYTSDDMLWILFSTWEPDTAKNVLTTNSKDAFGIQLHRAAEEALKKLLQMDPKHDLYSMIATLMHINDTQPIDHIKLMFKQAGTSNALDLDFESMCLTN